MKKETNTTAIKHIDKSPDYGSVKLVRGEIGPVRAVSERLELSLALSLDVVRGRFGGRPWTDSQLLQE
ncbi:hypothetical protein EVAR_61424_1 [Eumeta japonica]|uniref:Uncharacterized protein n=1 Tax=Eumeta variegata TaxID=151549 RepID=A0A4C1Y7G1_EUMVA|nr:hypothetical protein EVAR_61424_1 [Eumeta japonica]